jgi:2C-methyl-D-erythritol 2,4-cyclodiphosphate synthase
MKLVKINNKITEFQIAQITRTNDIVAALGGDNETSLLSQIQKMRSEQNDILTSIANILTKNYDETSVQTTTLNEIIIALGGDNDSDLFGQIQIMRSA